MWGAGCSNCTSVSILDNSFLKATKVTRFHICHSFSALAGQVTHSVHGLNVRSLDQEFWIYPIYDFSVRLKLLTFATNITVRPFHEMSMVFNIIHWQAFVVSKQVYIIRNKGISYFSHKFIQA